MGHAAIGFEIRDMYRFFEIGNVSLDFHVKPSNIMIDKEGNARIMDFWIAPSLHTKGITAEGVIVGTPVEELKVIATSAVMRIREIEKTPQKISKDL